MYLLQAGGSAYDLDSLRAREAWFRLKLLWSVGSCLSFRDMAQGRPYNASEWPECGPELARMRAELVGCQQGTTPTVSILTFEMRRALMVASTSSDSPLVTLLYDPLLREEECRTATALQDGGRCDEQCELYLTECTRLEALATGLPCSAWAAFEWDGSDCTLQALLLGDRCPPVPEHMHNLSRSVALEQEGWQVRLLLS